MKKDEPTASSGSSKAVLVVGIAVAVVVIIGIIWVVIALTGRSDDDKMTTAAPQTTGDLTTAAIEPSTERGEPRLTVTVTPPADSTDGQEPKVLVYENPETGTMVLDGLIMPGKQILNDDKGTHETIYRTPGTITITGVSETAIDLLAVYANEDGTGLRMEQKLQVKLGKETTFNSPDGQTVKLKYE